MSQPATAGTGPERNLLERLLGAFAEVRPREGASVLLMFANIFLILTAYYMLKVVREGLILGGVSLWGMPGDEIKAYMPAVMTFLLLGVVPLYGKLASTVSRIRLLNTTTGLVIATLAAFWLWGSAAGVGTAIGISFFVYLGIVNVFLIAQFWSFANDIYTREQGERLFAVIAIGQSLGAVLGPRLAGIGADHIFVLLLLAAGIFAVCMLLYNVMDRRTREAPAGTDAALPDEEPLEDAGSFALVFRTPYLLAIACMILVTNVVNTTGEYILANAARTHAEETVPALDPSFEPRVQEEAQELLDRGQASDPEAAMSSARETLLRGERSQEIGRFYAEFFFWVNLIGVGVQMFLVSRILKWVGVRAALFVLPLIAFGGYAAFAAIGGLAVLRVAKTAENSTDYSLQNTVKQALFLPTTREEKYKAKAAIDTFFVRFGDTASSLIVFAGLNLVGLGARGFAGVNVGLAVVWIALNLGIAREHRKLAPEDEA